MQAGAEDVSIVLMPLPQTILVKRSAGYLMRLKKWKEIADNLRIRFSERTRQHISVLKLLPLFNIAHEKTPTSEDEGV